MGFFFLPSLFKKHHKTLKTPESIIFKELKNTCEKNGLLTYEDITVYHYAKKVHIPLIIVDPKRGVYIFENKEYSYDDISSNRVKISVEEELSSNSSYELIEQKLQELNGDYDPVPIFNFYLMEHINSYEYDHLNPLIKELLPKDNIMFNDFSQKKILERLQKPDIIDISALDLDRVIGTILVQYSIVNCSGNINIATDEQKKFIDADFNSLEYLYGDSKTGKTQAAVMRVILQKLKDPELNIIVIKPTTLACDIFKRKLLKIIDSVLIDIDITSIEVITPMELLKKHLKKLSKSDVGSEAYLSNLLMNKEFDAADVIVCDDSDTMTKEFLKYLRHIQHDSNLLIINSESMFHKTYRFNKSFKNENREVIFEKTNPHARVFHIVLSLLKNNDPKDILVVSSPVTTEVLNHDLGSYIDKNTELIDSSKKLIFKDTNSVMLSSYSQTNSLEAKFVILLDIGFADEKELKYAYNLAQERVYVLYRGHSNNLDKLKEIYENSKK